MSTVSEIEKAIAALPPTEWLRVRRWMDAHAPQEVGADIRDLARFDQWLASSVGLAKGSFTTAERMRETRGED